MLPQKHFDRIEKAAAEILNASTESSDLKKSKKVIEIKENSIDKSIRTSTVSDDEYDDEYEYNYDDSDSDTDGDTIVTITPKPVPTTKRKCLILMPLFSQ